MTKIELSHQGFELTKEIKQYVDKKVAKLSRFVMRGSRRGMHVEVKLREEQGRKKNKCTAEMIVHLPNETITAKESTVNIYAAVDIVEAKISNQLRKYKDKRTSRRFDRKTMFRRIRRQADSERE